MKVRSIIVLVVLALTTVGCNNFFHDLIPPDGDRILSFRVPGQINAATIGDNTITVTVSRGTAVHELYPAIEVSPKASLIPITLNYVQAAFPQANVAKEALALYQASDFSGYVYDLIRRNPGFNVPPLSMPIDFSRQVHFFVISALGTIRQYSVHVVEDSGEPRLLGLRFSKYDNPELVSDALCFVSEAGRSVNALALYPAEMDSLSFRLVPSFEILGDGLEIDGVEIQSGQSAVQFGAGMGTQYKTITVKRGELSADYSLAVLFAEDPDTIRSITDFRFNKADNPSIAATSVASIVNNGDVGTITLQVFYSGAQPSTLVPRFVTPGTVRVGGTVQNSGIHSHDFSSPLEYRVVSRNGMYSRAYTVRVEFVSLSASAPRITAFRFSQALNPDLIRDSTGAIGDGLIMIDVQYGGSVAPQTLIPEFSAEGLVTVLGSVQVSGSSGQDFSRQIRYTVTNPDNPLLTRDYWVQARMVRDTSSDAAITAFGFYPDDNPGLGLAEPLIGAISHDTISVYVLAGLNVTDRVMIPRFTAAGQVSVNGAIQSSGVSGLIFDRPIVYTVVSANGLNRRDYTVNVRELKPTIYVNQNATGMGDGLTWQDAFTDLRLACEAAAGLPADVSKEIWIAKGTYTPGPDTDYYFPVAPNTSYIGGFGGWESFKSQRNKAVNPVVISGDIPRGSLPSLTNNIYVLRAAAFYRDRNDPLDSGNVSFIDLEFRDFMQSTTDDPIYLYFGYAPIYIGNSTGENLLEVQGCYFANINNNCIIKQGGSIILKDIRASNVAGLFFGSRLIGHNLIDNVEIISQIQSYGFYGDDIIGFGLNSPDASMTISNIMLKDTTGGITGEGSYGNINIKNFQAINITVGSGYMSEIFYISSLYNVTISNVDIDGVYGDYSRPINITNIRNSIILENIAIKNIYIPIPSSYYNNHRVIYIDNYLGYSPPSVVINNCYFDAFGTSPSYLIEVTENYSDLTIKNTRFNFNNQSPNLGAIKASRGFNLENVSFENSVSNTLLAIDGNYPYRVKRSGSFYNGASLSGDAIFAELSGRVQSTGGAVLTGEP